MSSKRFLPSEMAFGPLLLLILCLTSVFTLAENESEEKKPRSEKPAKQTNDDSHLVRRKRETTDQKNPLTWDKFEKLALMNSSKDGFLKGMKKYYPHIFSPNNNLPLEKSESPCIGDLDGEQPGEFPGMFHFDRESKLLFRYFGNPNGECSNLVEVLAYTGNEKQPYDTYLIEWKPNDPDPKIIKNDKSCTNCHGQPPLPIFMRDDNIWINFYGSQVGSINDNTEGNHFDNFLKKSVKKFPYLLLEGYDGVDGITKLPREGDREDLKVRGASSVLKKFIGNKIIHDAPHVIPSINAFNTIVGTIPGDNFHRFGLSGTGDDRKIKLSGVPTDCFNCHVVQKPQSSPVIAFDDQESLRKQLHTGNYYEVIVHEVESGKMPLNRKLKKAEKMALLKFLRETYESSGKE